MHNSPQSKERNNKAISRSTTTKLPNRAMAMPLTIFSCQTTLM